MKNIPKTKDYKVKHEETKNSNPDFDQKNTDTNNKNNSDTANVKKESSLDKDNEKIKQLTNKIEELQQLNDKLLFSLSSSQSENNRLENEVEIQKKQSLTKITKDLSEPIDIFFMATESVKKEDLEGNSSFKQFFDGIAMVKNQMINILSKHNISRIFPIGEKFNSAFHQALAAEKSSKPKGEIIKIIKPGYTLNNVIIIPSMVVVSDGAEEGINEKN